ncbi:hypothetical protein L7F22_017503 [Adiantum nelumboides]|nr:hypothetical protein [Adiantum nelumboides]
MAFPNFYGKPGEAAPDFLDNLEMAFLVSGRDDEATKLRAFPLVLREGAKAWYQTLAPEERRDWETLKTAFIEEFRHQEPPEEIWRQLLELRQTSPNDYRSYEGKFSNLWEKWCASLGEGERAPECLKKDCFLAGLYPILREKVKVKFPDTFEKAMAYAREKDRKLKFQAQLQGGMEPPPPAQPIARTVAGTSVTDQESSQQELLQQITNQLESLSINLVQGVRAPQSGNDRNRQEGQRQPREYVCYNCGEVGHGMYFCPHPRRYQGNGNHRRAPRQQVTPPRARPPNGQQNAPVAPPVQILRPPPPPPQTPAEIPPLPSGGEDRAVSVINFLDNLEMAFLVSGRDDEATKLRAFPLVLREGAKAWYQTLAPEERRDWETLKTAFIEEFRHQEPPEEIWRQLLELRQTSPNDYRSYEGKFSNLWEKWCASLGEGERAPECLKKDCFLAGLYPILREKVKVKFPDTFEKAMAYAREKDRKLKFQAQLQGGMEPPPPAQPIARTVAGTSVTDQESSQQELLQQITNQLESLSINLVQGVRAPQSGNDRNRQEGQRQPREYVCYNCGEVGHGMYFCPHPRRYQGNGNHRRAPRQQVTPPRARPPNGQQNAPVAPPVQILRPPPSPPQTPAEIPPLPSGGEDRVVSVISVPLSALKLPSTGAVTAPAAAPAHLHLHKQKMVSLQAFCFSWDDQCRPTTILRCLPLFFLLLLFCPVSFFLPCQPVAEAASSYLGAAYLTCMRNATSRLSSTYSRNLDTTLQNLTALSSQGTRYATTTSGSGAGNTVYAMFQCRGDQSRDLCWECMQNATVRLPQHVCPNSLGARIQLDGCYLRYDNQYFFQLDTTYAIGYCYAPTSDPVALVTIANLVENVTKLAPQQGGFAAASAIGEYAAAQCLGYLSESECSACLTTVPYRTVCNATLGEQVHLTSCYYRFEPYSFLEAPPLPDQARNRPMRKF